MLQAINMGIRTTICPLAHIFPLTMTAPYYRKSKLWSCRRRKKRHNEYYRNELAVSNLCGRDVEPDTPVDCRMGRANGWQRRHHGEHAAHVGKPIGLKQRPTEGIGRV